MKSEYSQIATECMHGLTITSIYRLSNAIIHLCHTFDGGLAKPPLKLRYGWVIVSYDKPRKYLIIYAIILVKICLQNMMTSSNGSIFRVTGPLCGNSPVTGEFPSQRPVTRIFDVFFDRLNKRFSKQSWGWWFETPSHSLWHHCNGGHWWQMRIMTPATNMLTHGRLICHVFRFRNMILTQQSILHHNRYSHLTHSGLMRLMDMEIWADTELGNNLLSDGTEYLSDSAVTYCLLNP